MKVKFILLNFFINIVLIGCDAQMKENIQIEKAVGTELDTLKKFVKIPGNPELIKWEIIEDSDRGTGSLTALLSYSTEEFRSIKEESAPHEVKGKNYITDEAYNSWLSKEQRADLKVTVEAGAIELLNAESTTPSAFVDTNLSPYVNGNVVFFENHFVLLELYSL